LKKLKNSQRLFLISMVKDISKLALLFILLSVLILPNFSVLAQEECTTKEECETLLKKYEEQISQYEKDISKTQKEKKTLQNQIYILKKKIDKLNLQIQQNNVIIKDIGLQVKDTGKSIEKTSDEIEKKRKELTTILETIYKEDQKGLIEILLSEENLSGFFNNLTALESLNSRSQELLGKVKDLKSDLEKQKESLEEEKEELEKMLKIQILQKEESAANKKEQEELLKITKGKESEYQKILVATKKKAAEIKSRLFELIGVAKVPNFGEVLEIAKYVEKITGVRPAFLLAVIEQESALGKNIGQCYLTDFQSGSGVSIKNGSTISKVMAPGPPYSITNNVEVFLQITEELGRDPLKTPVSCPMSFGWGGAMGPAQFIPSTWLKYKDRVSAITGKPSDPWNIKDSFLAAGFYLADYGAASQREDDEWKAAMIYFSGTTNSKYKFYGNSVLNRTKRIEDWIETIERVS